MQIRCPRFFVALMGFSLLSACASTSVRSQTDPQLAGRTFHKVLVFVNLSDLGLRQDAERQFRTTLAAYRVEAVPSAEFFFPGRTYVAEEVGKILADAQIEAVLIVAAAGTGTSASWIPQTATTQGTATVSGNTVTGRATTQTYGGYYVNKPWAQFDASLFDLASGKNVWVASMSSKGNAFAGWDDLARSMAKKTAARLVKDRIVK